MNAIGNLVFAVLMSGALLCAGLYAASEVQIQNHQQADQLAKQEKRGVAKLQTAFMLKGF